MDTFRQHIYGCFIDDVHGVQESRCHRVDNVMIETDYPHSDSTWPQLPRACQEAVRTSRPRIGTRSCGATQSACSGSRRRRITRSSA